MRTDLKFYKYEIFFKEVKSGLSGQADWHNNLLNGIREFNHATIDNLNTISNLKGKKILDIGGSSQGYALEKALELGAGLYVGIGIEESLKEGKFFLSDKGTGLLLYMDGMHTDFPANSFDLVVSMSTFEHIGDPGLALEEIFRVLIPGGKALITFEPVWTCSYGHHLHFLGDQMASVKPWSHLLYKPDEFLSDISKDWREGHFNKEQAVNFVYYENDINRIDIREHKKAFKNSKFRIDWMVDLKEDSFDLDTVKKVSNITGYSVDELTTKGLSVLLSKPGNFFEKLLS